MNLPKFLFGCILKTMEKSAKRSVSMQDQIHKFTLDQFLKQEGWVDTGGQAKFAIQDGQVKVNGEVETRRRRQLTLGDVIEFDAFRATVTADQMNR
jgi:ribosome-associated protein